MHKLYVLLLLLPALSWSACESDAEKIASRTAAAQKSGQQLAAPDGMAVFRQNCVICHGADGRLGLNGAKDLSVSILPLEERIQIITQGKNLMTPFGKILSPGEITAVADYTLHLKQAKNDQK
ncbi:MAG: cytochrome c [Saprospiraceae bacterium]